jgi:hypothetical protein
MHVVPRHVQVTRGGIEKPVAQQFANRDQVHAGFEQVSGERVPQAVHATPALDPRPLFGLIEDPGKRIFAVVPLASGEQPVVRLDGPPVATQFLQQLRRKQAVAVPIAFAGANQDHHPVRMNVSDLELDHFAGTQAGSISRHQHGSMLEVAGRLEQTPNFAAAEWLRQAAGSPAFDLQVKRGVFQDAPIEKLNPGNLKIDAGSRKPFFDNRMVDEVTDFLQANLLGGPLIMLCQLVDRGETI